jgi:hypothetical protein
MNAEGNLHESESTDTGMEVLAIDVHVASSKQVHPQHQHGAAATSARCGLAFFFFFFLFYALVNWLLNFLLKRVLLSVVSTRANHSLLAP